jgi:hypothetical protein
MIAPRYAKRYNFSPIFRGDSLIVPTIQFDFGTAGLTIKNAFMQIRDNNNKLVTDVPLNVSPTSISATPVSTEDFPIGTLQYDIQTNLSNNTVRTYLYGKLEVSPDVTVI